MSWLRFSFIFFLIISQYGICDDDDWDEYFKNEIIHLPYQIDEDDDEEEDEGDSDEGNSTSEQTESVSSSSSSNVGQSESSSHKKELFLNTSSALFSNSSSPSSVTSSKPSTVTTPSHSNAIAFFKEGVPTAVVDGVDVISGFYSQMFADHEIMGPVVLAVERSYASYRGEDGFALFNFTGAFGHHNHIHCQSHSGSWKSLYRSQENTFAFDTNKNGGWSNVTDFGPAGFADPTNTKLIEYDEALNPGSRFFRVSQVKDRKIELLNSNGEKSTFHSYACKKTDISGYKAIENVFFHLQEKILPSGHRLKYNYSDKEQLKHISLYSPDNKRELSWISILESEGANNATTKIIETSDGKKLKYFQEKAGKAHHLTAFSSNFGKKETYHYEKFSSEHQRLVGISNLTGLQVSLSYYKNGSNDDDFESTSLKGNSIVIGRVHKILRPLGENNKNIASKTFEYYPANHNPKKHRYRKLEGYGTTRVYNSQGVQTYYHYNELKRIHSIDYYDLENKLHHQEHFVWREGIEAGRLQAKYLTNKDKNILVARTFKYDKQGNVVEEILHGHFSGKQNLSKQKLLPNFIKDSCVESYHKYYKYDERLPVVLAKWEESGKREEFEYLSGTNLLTAHFIYDQGCIVKREFKSYDEDRMLAEIIEDDGSSKTRENLTNVTRRFIKKITPRKIQPGLGLPERVEKYAQDKNGYPILVEAFEFIYDGNHNLTQKIRIYKDGNKKVEEALTYDERSNLVEERNALGQTKRHQYDASDRKILTILEDGISTIHFEYDKADRLIAKIEKITGDERKETYQYDSENNLIARTDTYGNTTRFEYDAWGKEIASILPATINTTHAILKQSYDTLGFISEKVDARGNITKAYNTHLGKPYLIEYPDGAKEYKFYSTDGKLVKEISPCDLITEYTYDWQDRIIEEKQTDSKTGRSRSLKRAYDAWNLLWEEDFAGNRIAYSYDIVGRKVAESENDLTEKFYYDEKSRLIKQETHHFNKLIAYVEKEFDELDRAISEKHYSTKGLQQIISYQYNLFGHICEKNVGEIIEKTTYDPWGRVLTRENHTKTSYKYLKEPHGTSYLPISIATDVNGLENWIYYEALGRIYKEEQKKNGTILSQRLKNYDLDGNCIHEEEAHLKDGKTINHAFKVDYVYNSKNQLIEQREPNNKSTYRKYDPEGKVIEKKKPDGISIFYEYDAFGRLTRLSTSDRSLEYYYTYNDKGQLVHVKDGNNYVINKRKYDKQGNVIEEEFAHGKKIYKEFDPSDNLTKLIFPDGSSLTYEYEGNLLKQIERKDQYAKLLFSQEYTKHNLTGHVEKVKLPCNLCDLNIQYDKHGRPIKLASKFHSEEITYDAVGNVQKHNFLDNNTSYNYDSLNQISLEHNSQQIHYWHDSMHNCLQENEEYFDINESNLVLSSNNNLKVEYDSNRNLIYKKQNGTETHYKYDALDRLIEIRSNEEIVQFEYDHTTRPIIQKKPKKDTSLFSWDSSESSYFLYDEDLELGLMNGEKFLELRHLGSCSRLDIGAIFAIEKEGKIYAPIHDYRGNISLVIDAENKQIVERISYTAYGKETILDSYGKSKASVISPWRFQSKRTLENGFVIFPVRIYDSSIKRWMTPDPSGFADGLNLYSYVHANPLIYCDPYGNLTDDQIQGMALGAAKGGINLALAIACGKAGAAAGSAIGGPFGTVIGFGVGFAAGFVTSSITNYCADQSLKAMDLSPEAKKYYKNTELVVDMGTVAYGGIKSAWQGIKDYNQLQQSTKLLAPQRTASGKLANRNLAILEKSAEEVQKINAISNNLIKPNIVDHVIQETLMNTGNFTSKYTLTADQALEAGMKFLGKGYREIGRPGQGIFRSLDGLRQFRIDARSLEGVHFPNKPHIHLEYFPKNSNQFISNNHILFIK